MTKFAAFVTVGLVALFMASGCGGSKDGLPEPGTTFAGPLFHNDDEVGAMKFTVSEDGESISTWLYDIDVLFDVLPDAIGLSPCGQIYRGGRTLGLGDIEFEGGEEERRLPIEGGAFRDDSQDETPFAGEFTSATTAEGTIHYCPHGTPFQPRLPLPNPFNAELDLQWNAEAVKDGDE